jgi:DUF4097 and DUF4098 domain-containing protein YvlB
MVRKRTLNPIQAKWRRSTGWVLLLLGVPVGALIAANPARVEKTLQFQTGPSPRITLSNLSGQVVVRGWDKGQVRALCATASPQVSIEAEPMPATGTADKIHFTTHILDPMLTGQTEVADYTLDVPLESSLEIRNRQGSVRIEKLSGEAWVESVGGAIIVTDVSGHLAVRSVGGNIDVIRCSGRVEASSITGNLRFVSPTTSKLRGTTTSGKIVYEGDFAPGGDYILSEYSGEMEILCPASSSFELNAKSVRGKVQTDPELSLVPRHHPDYPPVGASSLFGTHNSGNATVELTSFSGNIHIRRQP